MCLCWVLTWGRPLLYLGVAANRQPIALPHQNNLQMAGSLWFKVKPYYNLPPESEPMMLSCPWVLEGKNEGVSVPGWCLMPAWCGCLCLVDLTCSGKGRGFLKNNRNAALVALTRCS